MTPIAHELAIDSTLPVAQRRHGDLAKQIGLFDDLHFFDVSAVYAAAHDLAEKNLAAVIAGRRERMFLPAPRVLLEWTGPWLSLARREAVLLEDCRDGSAVGRFVSLLKDGRILVTPERAFVMPLSGNRDFETIRFLRDGPFNEDETLGLVQQCYALLAMINTPRVIGRRIHQPHAGLQRKVAAAHAMSGKYPLQAWHELVLEVKPPRDESDLDPRKTILTGGKALHFVRAYLRISGGSLQLVSSHWKGDPALGLKQTRYRVIPPKSRAA